MISNVNFDTRPVLQLYVIALCVVRQTFNWKITKTVEIYWFRLQHYFEISLTGNVFAVPTVSSAGLTGSDVILRIG